MKTRKNKKDKDVVLDMRNYRNQADDTVQNDTAQGDDVPKTAAVAQPKNVVVAQSKNDAVAQSKNAAAQSKNDAAQSKNAAAQSKTAAAQSKNADKESVGSVHSEIAANDKNESLSKDEAFSQTDLEIAAVADKDGTDKESVHIGFWSLVLEKTKKLANFVFIDGFSGMALGLFATLIIGTIISQIGKYVGNNFVGNTLTQIGTAAKILMGPGIGVGMACKFKKSPLLAVSAGVAGLIGAHAGNILEIIRMGSESSTLAIGAPGEPVGAFVAAIVAIGFGGLVAGKTKLDIIITPMIAIILGAVAGLLVGPPISAGLGAIGDAVNWAMEQNKIIMGIIIAVIMGIVLTSPISSAALGVTLQLSGLAAGAATVGCCCQMVGFAVSSFRENKWGGLVAQGLGTSMLQMPNIVKKPRIWLPTIITSAILGPVSSAAFGMTSNAIGSGMGTAGLVGPLMVFETMVADVETWYVALQILLMCFLLPALICLALSEVMRKIGWIKKDDMRLNIN